MLKDYELQPGCLLKTKPTGVLRSFMTIIIKNEGNHITEWSPQHGIYHSFSSDYIEYNWTVLFISNGSKD